LIAGGRDKESPFELLRDSMTRSVRYLILIGEAAPNIKKALGDIVSFFDVSSMEEAVRVSWELAREGDTVLLSPACASFDMFENYKVRGDAFQKAVKLLRGRSRQYA